MSSEVKVNKISPSSGTSIVIGDSGDTVSLGSGVSASGFGKILQVLQTVKTDVFSTGAGANSPAEITGLTASITPASSSNKVLVMFSISLGSSSTNNGACFLYRDSTAIQIGDARGSRPRSSKNWETSNTWNQSEVTIVCLDSPSTTSSVTYSVKIGGNGSVTNYVNRSGRDTDGSTEDCTNASQVILMEIEG